MSDFQRGDLVVCVHWSKCLYGRNVHEGETPDGADLTNTIHRVSGWQRDEEAGYPGGWLLFADGEAWCDGCCHKLNDGTDDAELIERIRRCRPVRIGEPA